MMNRGGRWLLLALATSLGLLSAAAWLEADPRPKELKRLADKYSLKITVRTGAFKDPVGRGKATGSAATPQQVQAFAGLLTEEFSIYPVSLVKKSKLVEIVLCTELAFSGQARTAIPDFEKHTLYLDIVRGSFAKTYVRKVVHHEYFHMLDMRDDGKLYRDKSWSALNAAGFSYGTGGQNAQDDSGTSVLNKDTPGFLNRYSTTGVEEDKAEVYANMVVAWSVVEKRAKKDPVLAKKVARMKELLKQFCPEMNEEFWKKARELRRIDKR